MQTFSYFTDTFWIIRFERFQILLNNSVQRKQGRRQTEYNSGINRSILFSVDWRTLNWMKTISYEHTPQLVLQRRARKQTIIEGWRVFMFASRRVVDNPRLCRLSIFSRNCSMREVKLLSNNFTWCFLHNSCLNLVPNHCVILG